MAGASLAPRAVPGGATVSGWLGARRVRGVEDALIQEQTPATGAHSGEPGMRTPSAGPRAPAVRDLETSRSGRRPGCRRPPGLALARNNASSLRCPISAAWSVC
jgi:hypothetical protein